MCIAGILAHICAAERYWLGEVQIPASFRVPGEPDCHPETFEAALHGIELQYHDVLRERPDDPDVLFGLGRVCQHNLYHVAQIVHLRSLHEPDWTPPPPGHRGSWERAADYMSDLLILGEKAPAEPPNPESALKE